MSQTWIPNTSGELDSTDTLSDSRTYINDALEALRSSWSGANAPSSPSAGQLFFDTDTNKLYCYNGASWKQIGDADLEWFGLLPLIAGSSYPLSGDLYCGSKQIKSVADPTLSTDAMTKNYADTTYLAKAGGTMAGNIVMGAYDITMDHNPDAATELARKAYVDLFLPLAGGTMSGSVAMGGYKLTGLGAGTASSNDSCRMAEFSAAFDTSTGHDHDASDSKKVLVTNLDATGTSNGYFATANANAVQMVIPWGYARSATPSITGSYADIVEVTLSMPRTTTAFYGNFTCTVTVEATDAITGGTVDIRILNAANATQREKTSIVWSPDLASGDSVAIPLAFSYVWVPGSAGNETFTVQLKRAIAGGNGTITITDAVLWCNTIG